MKITNESIIELRNVVDNAIQQLIRQTDDSQLLNYSTRQTEHISNLSEVFNKIIEKYSYITNDYNWNRKVLFSLYLFYKEFFEKEEPFNEDSATRKWIKHFLD